MVDKEEFREVEQTWGALRDGEVERIRPDASFLYVHVAGKRPQ